MKREREGERGLVWHVLDGADGRRNRRRRLVVTLERRERDGPSAAGEDLVAG